MKNNFFTISFLLLFPLAFLPENAAGVVRCGVYGPDGREIGCPDDTKCVFNNIRNAVNCRCKSKERNPLTKQYDALTPCSAVEEYFGPKREKKPALKKEKPSPPEKQPPSVVKKLKELKEIVKEGDFKFQNGDYGGAIDEWEKAVILEPALESRLNPFIARAYAKRGAASYLKGDYKLAVLDFDQALALNPEMAEIRKARNQAELALSKMNRGETSVHSQVMAPTVVSVSSEQPQEPAKIPVGKRFPTSEEESERKKKLHRILYVLAGILITGSCVWIGFDASELMQDVSPADRKAIARLFPTPAEWVIASVFFWPVIFPLYLVKRGKYAALNPAVSSSTGKRSRISSRCSTPAEKVAKSRPDVLSKPVTPPVEVEQQISVPSPYAPPLTWTDKAVHAMKKGEYQQALELLGAKKKPDLFDYNLFLEIYVRLDDFTRAKLIAGQISEWLKANPRDKCDYKLCFSMADICKIKGMDELAHKLREIGLEGMTNQATVRELTRDYYELGVKFDNEGERELALRVYGLFEGLERPYRDVNERVRSLKERPAPPPPPKKQDPGSIFSRNGAHAAGFLLAGRYEIKRSVGEGGMGVVYEAWDRQANRKSAIKRMHSQLKQYPAEYERFKREARIMEKLKHPNIVSVQGMIEDEGETYLIFDYVEGRSISDMLKERKRFPLNECRDIFKGVCAAVHHAHANNVIHRDIKPSNIMMDIKGQAMVMDFGLASELRESLTRVTHQTMSGTPAYMAPEQHEGLVKKESDIYAMGVCLYEMLTGELPFSSFDFQKQKKNKNFQEISAKLPWLPSGVDEIIDRALDPEPSMRYGDALDFYDDLKKF